jgi:hypothetical protein
MMADCGETRIEKETITHFDFSSLPRKSVKMRKERERENCRHKRANSLIRTEFCTIHILAFVC